MSLVILRSTVITNSTFCPGSAAAGGGREHAAEEGGQDLRPDGQEPRRPTDPGGVSWG